MIARVVLVALGRNRVLFFAEQVKRLGVRWLDQEIGLGSRRRRRPRGTASDQQRHCEHASREPTHPPDPGLVSRRINRTVVPFLISLSIQILPPCASTTFLAKIGRAHV